MKREFRSEVMTAGSLHAELSVLFSDGWRVQGMTGTTVDAVPALIVLLERDVRQPDPRMTSADVQKRTESIADQIGALYLEASGEQATKLALAYHALTGSQPIPF